MKVLVFIVLIATCAPIAGAAQAPECKYQKNAVDKFTRQKQVWTKWNHTISWFNESAHHVNGYVSVMAEGDETYLGIKIKFETKSRRKPTKDSLDNAIVVPDGAQLFITMEDETAVTLNSDAVVHGTSQYSKPYSGINKTPDYITRTTAIVRYRMDASVLDGLRSQGATHVRLQEVNRDFHFEIDQKSIGDIQHAIECVQ